MPNDIKLEDLTGWLPPHDLSGYENFNFWFLLIPAGLLILGMIIPAIRQLPVVLTWLFTILLVGAAGFSFWHISFFQPQQKVATSEASYLKWFDKNYSYLDLTKEESLEMLHNQNGFLDEDAKRNYILETSTDKTDKLYVYYLSAKTEYAYRVAPQDVEKFDG